MEKDASVLFLFDLDGTLTAPRQAITAEMRDFLRTLSLRHSVGIVGGSDLEKLIDQMGGSEFIQELDYVFAENGLVAYKSGSLIAKQSISQAVGEERLQTFINFCLGYMSKLKLPKKRGTFIEFRNGMLNLCPVGRSCSQEERLEFFKYDEEHGVRKAFVEELKKMFPDYGLHFSIGGQISIDVFPIGWDKTYCLRLLDRNTIKTIHFFGDKTSLGGNDYEIFTHPDVVGHTVCSHVDTMAQVTQTLLELQSS